MTNQVFHLKIIIDVVASLLPADRTFKHVLGEFQPPLSFALFLLRSFSGA